MTTLEKPDEDPLADVERAAKRKRPAGLQPRRPVASGPSHIHVGADVQAAMERGVGYLARGQNRDGGWNSGENAGPADLANTSIAGLALLRTPTQNDAAPRAAARAAEFVAANATAALQDGQWRPTAVDGRVVGDLGACSDAALAALFLAQRVAHGGDDARPCRKPLERLLAVIDRHLEADPNAFKNGAHTLSRAVVAHAAEAAGRAGVAVPEDFVRRVVDGCSAHVDFYGRSARIGCLHASSRQAASGSTAAAAVAAEEFVKPMLAEPRGRLPFGAGGEVFLSLMFIGGMLSDAGTDVGAAWNMRANAQLVQAQNQDGSWTGSSCINSRVFCTASALLVLSPEPAGIRVAAR